MITLIAKVTRNNRPIDSAAFRSFFLFIVKFVKPCWGEVSAVVISRMMAPNANNKYRSEKLKGRSCMIYISSIRYSNLVVLFSGYLVSFWMLTGLPATLAKIQATVLLIIQPTCLWVLG